MGTILIIFATIPLDARATATTLRLFPLAARRFQPLHVESMDGGFWGWLAEGLPTAKDYGT
jgi:hypothetical protein